MTPATPMWKPAALALALVACGGPAAPKPASIDNQDPAPDVEAFEVTLKRTVCFGQCPTYVVTIRGDGTVRWHGYEAVEAKGDRSGTVTRDQLAELAASIDRVQFFELGADGKPKCKGPSCVIIDCTDTSHSIVTVKRQGRSYEVDNAHCGPSPADAIEEVIDRIAKIAAWVGNP